METKCPSCGETKQLKKYSELEYDDGSDEPNTSNTLIEVEIIECLTCGETFPPPTNSDK